MTTPSKHDRIMELQRRAKQQLDALKQTLAELDSIRGVQRSPDDPLTVRTADDAAQRPRLRVIVGGRS